MRESRAFIAGLAAFLAPISVQAESPNACLTITDKDARLACYDRSLGYAPPPPAAIDVRIANPCAADIPNPKSCDLVWSTGFGAWRAHCERVIYAAIDQPFMEPQNLNQVRCRVDNQADDGKRSPALAFETHRLHHRGYDGKPGRSEVMEYIMQDEFDPVCSLRVHFAVDDVAFDRIMTTFDQEIEALMSGSEAIVDTGGFWPECKRGRATYDLTGFGAAVEAARTKFKEYDTP